LTLDIRVISYGHGRRECASHRETNMTKIYYTCVGSVCGGCDVKHRSAEAAGRCCRQHHRDVARGNPGGRAYSDRGAVAVEAGVQRRLTDDEWCAE